MTSFIKSMDVLISIILMLATFAFSQIDMDDDKVRIVEKVFVYGSLKRGEPNHHLLKNKGDAAIYRNMATTLDLYPLVIASKYNIPYMLNTPGMGMNIQGELYDVDEKILSQLDALEGHPDYYNRTKVFLLENEIETEAWTYLLNDYKPFMDTLPYLESYSSNGSHGLPFVPREDRVPGDIHSFTEVKLSPKDVIVPNNSATFNTGSPTEKRHLIFVYGTLKGRERNHDQMTDSSNGLAQLIALANTEERFPLVIASRYNIPFLLDNTGVGKQIDGEIYIVNESMLRHLDEFEDYPIFYTRKVINVIHKNTRTLMKAWAYILHDYNTDLLQLPLLATYSSDESHGLSYEEPEELTEEQFNAMLAEVKNDKTA